MKFLLFLLVSSFAAAAGFAQSGKEFLLWPAGAPGSEGKTEPEAIVTGRNGERSISSVHKPAITPYLPAEGKSTGVGILVIPGGGHSVLAYDHEGVFVAQWFAEHGIAAFVLKYRLAREKGSTYTIEGNALPDTQRALRLIGSRAAEWQVDPAKLGAIGFSAGGELVALAWMRPSDGQPEAADPIDRLSGRPSFQGLLYPGRSDDILPTKDAPPAFLACSTFDRKDISEGLAEAYLRFKRSGAVAELHVYATGGHGFGLRPGMQGALAGWPDRFMEWLVSTKFLPAKN